MIKSTIFLKTSFNLVKKPIKTESLDLYYVYKPDCHTILPPKVLSIKNLILANLSEIFIGLGYNILSKNKYQDTLLYH